MSEKDLNLNSSDEVKKTLANEYRVPLLGQVSMRESEGMFIIPTQPSQQLREDFKAIEESERRADIEGSRITL